MGRIHEALIRAAGGERVEIPDVRRSLEDYPYEHQDHLDSDDRTSSVSVEDAEPTPTASSGLGISLERIRHYQRIAATLQAARDRRGGLKTVAIASVATGEGKTTTMLGIATALTRTNSSRVLLVDANFCRPTLHERFRTEPGPGLVDVISGERTQAVPVIVQPSLHVLLAGRASAHPASDLGSERLRGVLKLCAAHYDWVLVDTPAVEQLADEADVLGRLTDSVVFVIGANTPFAIAQRAMATIGDGRVLATLLDGLSDPVPSGNPPHRRM